MCVRVCAFYPAFFPPDRKRNPVADKKYWREKLNNSCPVLESPLCALSKPNNTCFPCHVLHAISRRHDQFAITVLQISYLFLLNYYYCYLHLPLARFLRETGAGLAAPQNLWGCRRDCPALLPSPPARPCPGPRGLAPAGAASAQQRGAARSPVLSNCGYDCTK